MTARKDSKGLAAYRSRAGASGRPEITPRPVISSTVIPLPLGELSGRDFERLVFALLLRRWAWRRLDWWGQRGDDGGRDIVGERATDTGGEERVVIACANWRRLTLTKARADIRKLVVGSPPQQLILVAGGPVSARLRAKVEAEGRAAGVARVEVWAGPEVEELLRLYAGSVLRRFFQGETLPDESSDLATFVAGTSVSDRDEALNILARVFDRPAFTTSIMSESSLPAFRKAIADTIEAINTGVARTRDGTPFARVPTRHDFAEPERSQLGRVVDALGRLREVYDRGLRSGSIRPCGCARVDCPTHEISDDAVRALEAARADVFRDLPPAARPRREAMR